MSTTAAVGPLSPENGKNSEKSLPLIGLGVCVCACARTRTGASACVLGEGVASMHLEQPVFATQLSRT